ncbi:MAG: hypothetical protein HZA79_12045 [Sphingobacteriales bacterium]|nr:hypothetical protein [Sphingobacteriales bacterium]
MKPASGFIWQLIHSLDSNEKLFFKRNFAPCVSPGQRLYIRLFDAIAAQKEYDEAAILKKFQPGLNKKNIAYQKHYLHRQICEALVQYDGRKNPGHDIYASIQLIRIYRKKGLYAEAFALWKKAVEKARTAEAFALLNLLKTEFEKMIIFSHTHSGYDELLSLFKKNAITYSEYAELITLRDVYTETLLLKRKTHLGQDDLLRERISSLMEKVNRADTVNHGHSFWYRHYYFMSKATLLYLENDMAGSLGILQELFADWKKNKRFLATHGEFYIELLYMINYAGILNGSYAVVTAIFNDELNHEIRDKTQRAYFEAIKYLALNKIYNKTAAYDEVQKLLVFMKSKYKLWEPVLNEELNSTVTLSLGIGCFVLEQYDDALYFIKRATTYFREATREEHASVAQLLLLLIRYNLNNPRLFDAQYRATYQYFYKKKKKAPFEQALVQCLHRAYYMKDNRMIRDEFRKTLELLAPTQEQVSQQRTFAIFNFPGWLNSKIQRITYRQYVEKKVKSGTTLTEITI